MGHGVPVVATDVGDVAELLDHGRCGVLTRPDDLDGLTSAITQLLDNPADAQHLAKRARDRYLSHYTLETMRHQVRNAYQAAVDLAADRDRQRKGAQ